MTDTDLIVPIEVHALLATRSVNEYDDFRRWTPKYAWTFSEGHRSNAEPSIHSSEGSPGEGVHVQWQLPEALATGVIDPVTGVSAFPLVPNRWLVIRYAQVRGELKAAGFLVHSDYLEKADGGPAESAFTPFVDPASPKEAPRSDYIGRVHPLTDGPWASPRGVRCSSPPSAAACPPSPPSLRTTRTSSSSTTPSPTSRPTRAIRRRAPSATA